MRGKHIENNSAYSLKISDSSSVGIAETLPYGKERKAACDLQIETVSTALSDCARQVKNGQNWKEKEYKEKKQEIAESGDTANSG